MTSIIKIKSYLPYKKLNTYKKFKEKYNRDFFINKIGTTHVRRVPKKNNEVVVDMCVEAFKKLNIKNKKKIKVIILCTQNPDYGGLPHNSAIIQNRLKKIYNNIDHNVACFDISLGCSGYIYCLKLIQTFLKYGEQGLIFTCDPYSKIIKPGDSNTELLFGDAATASLVINNNNKIEYEFHTYGEYFQNLIKNNGILHMNGRKIFNFCLDNIPPLLNKFLKKNDLKIDQIKSFYFNQGSKYIIKSIAKKMHLKNYQIPIFLDQIGNTVSSSIPLTMELHNFNKRKKPIILCGFGVGLSISICLIS